MFIHYYLRQEMPDFIDRSVEHQEELLQRDIERAKKVDPATRLSPMGRCHFCRERLDNDKMLFCDADCAADHERLMHKERNRRVA